MVSVVPDDGGGKTCGEQNQDEDEKPEAAALEDGRSGHQLNGDAMKLVFL